MTHYDGDDGPVPGYDDDGREVPNEDPSATDLRERAWTFVPWDEEAEASLVGAMLLTPDAIRAGKAGCTPDDFYKPEYRLIFEACIALFDGGLDADPVTVYDRLIEPGGKEAVPKRRLMELQTGCPASWHAATYARIVSDYARARAAMSGGHDLLEAGREGRTDDLDAIVARVAERVRPSVLHVKAYDLTELWDLADAEREDPTKPFVIPGCLRTCEVCALTGSEGIGKSMYLRQIAVCVASGIHPFTGLALNMERQSTLYVDLQEDDVDMADELVKLRRAVERTYEPGWYHAVSFVEGLDLLSPRGQRVMEGLLGEYRPRLVVMGPVNSMFRAGEGRSRYGEDVIEELRAFMVEQMKRFDFALILEGHAGNERSHDEDWRIRGSSVWRSWPAFSHGLKEVAKDPREVDVIRARRDRYAGRTWPTKLYEKPGRLPWEPSNGDYGDILRGMGLAHLLGENTQEEMLGSGGEKF